MVEERNEKDSFLGSPLRSGYQSHYVLTEISGTPVTKIDPHRKYRYDEIVVVQEAQVRSPFIHLRAGSSAKSKSTLIIEGGCYLI